MSQPVKEAECKLEINFYESIATR